MVKIQSFCRFDLMKNNLPLLKNRFIKDKTLIYVCVNKACKMPTESVEESVSLINY